MKRLIPLVLLVLVSVFSCTDRDDNIDSVNIRIKNVSDLSFDTVQVGNADAVHENVAPGEFSEYFSYEEAYRYAYIELVAAGETYILQPIDFVGEDPLNVGFYTYELLPVTGGQVRLNFVAD